jgi:hypothetical protein
MMQIPTLLKSTKVDALVDMPENSLRFGAYIYRPAQDITTYELAKLLELFTFAFNYAVKPLSHDYESFVKRHNLERHFIRG